jgi:hypothetical protein
MPGAAPRATQEPGILPYQNLLGASLAGQDKFAEAEPLLVDGLKGMEACAWQIRPWEKRLLHQARERVGQLK